MKIVYGEKYRTVYSSDPAAAPGRMESILDELGGAFDFVEPEPASEEDICLVHTRSHLDRIKKKPVIYEVALLSAGGAIKASEIAMEEGPAFGLIRPPGHHASPDNCWGFCYFNNIAVSVEKLRRSGKIKSAVIVDFDLHYGDGTANIFAHVDEVVYHHLGGRDRVAILEDLESFLSSLRTCDVICVSAGFDNHEEDWGGALKTQDYNEIGKIIKERADALCGGKRYGVLEGGYNHMVLGKNVRAFLAGFG